MPHRFPTLAPPEPPPARNIALMVQSLPIAEWCLALLIGLLLLA